MPRKPECARCGKWKANEREAYCPSCRAAYWKEYRVNRKFVGPKKPLANFQGSVERVSPTAAPTWKPYQPKPLPFGIAERMAAYRAIRSPYSEPRND